MTAEIMREAATLMRERAEAATPGAWEAYRTDTCSAVRRIDAPLSGYGSRRIIFSQVGAAQHWAPADAPPDSNIVHIAAVGNPAVALAVADWLEVTASHGDPGTHPWFAALAVARAYLGRDA